MGRLHRKSSPTKDLHLRRSRRTSRSSLDRETRPTKRLRRNSYNVKSTYEIPFDEEVLSIEEDDDEKEDERLAIPKSFLNKGRRKSAPSKLSSSRKKSNSLTNSSTEDSEVVLGDNDFIVSDASSRDTSYHEMYDDDLVNSDGESSSASDSSNLKSKHKSKSLNSASQSGRQDHILGLSDSDNPASQEENEDVARLLLSKSRTKFKFAQNPVISSKYDAPMLDELVAVQKLDSSNGHGRKETDKRRIVQLSDFVFVNDDGRKVEIELQKSRSSTKFKKTNSGLLKNPCWVIATILENDNPVVENVRIRCKEISIRGYSQEFDKPFKYYLKSDKDVSYQYLLESPAEEYSKHWTNFQFKFTLSRLFINFILEYPRSTLDTFRFKFTRWLVSRNVPSINSWLDSLPYTDFRNIINAHQNFLLSECSRVAHRLKFPHRLPIFRQMISLKLNGLGGKRHRRKMTKTLVTMNAYEWFNEIFQHAETSILEPIHKQLRPSLIEIKNSSSTSHKHREESPQSSNDDSDSDIELSNPIEGQDDAFLTCSVDGLLFNVNDVVQINVQYGQKDSQDWQGDAYALVTRILGGRNPRVLIAWLYTASQTCIGSHNHDDPRELFLSKHCECEVKGVSPHSVMKKVNVRWDYDGRMNSSCEFYVRYFYDHEEGSFESVKPSQYQIEGDRLPCGCDPVSKATIPKEIAAKFHVGDCILIEPKDEASKLLMICTIENDQPEGFLLRIWVQARAFFNNAAINELVATEAYISKFKDFKRIRVKGYLEYVEPGTKLATHLLHKGAGSHMFFSRTLDGSPVSEELKAMFPALQPWSKKLSVLDLFCGSGNLGHGLQDSGLCQVKWGVDADEEVLLTFAANHTDPVECIPKDMNSLLRKAVAGTLPASYPQLDEVDVISAGPPCQGFSSLSNWHEGAVFKNSMLVSVASFMDIYSPKYLLLENVPETVKTELFKFFVSFLIRLDYQVRYQVLGAWQHGVPQGRRRVFLWAAKKGYLLPKMPQASHGEYTRSNIFKYNMSLPSGERHANVEDVDFSIFPPLSVGDMTSDLPDKTDWTVRDCISIPDHYEAASLNDYDREIIPKIPIEAPGISYGHMLETPGIIPKNHWAHWDRTDKRKLDRAYKSYVRVEAGLLFPTLTGKAHPVGYPGKTLHPTQNRIFTIRELMRGQGFLNSDVLVGRPSVQLRIIGNCVPRSVAFALGVELRRAVEENQELMETQE